MSAKTEMPEKGDKRPRPCELRNYVPMVAKIEFHSGGYCEVYSNGYAIYDNGNRKAVVWVPDCSSVTYYFGQLKEKEKEYLDQKKEISEDELGPLPWYHAVMICGEDRIEYNMEHPKSKGNASDTENPEEWEQKTNYRWNCGAHFDGPEETYLKKEAEAERRELYEGRMREVYVLYYEKEYNEREIGEILGIERATVDTYLRRAREKMRKKGKENFFSEL